MRGLFGHGGGLAMAGIAAAVAASVSGAGPLVIHLGNPKDSNPPSEPARKRRRAVPARPKFTGNDPRVNRWTGNPHTHARAAARHAAQVERVNCNRAARACAADPARWTAAAKDCDPYGLTRRGRYVSLLP